MFLKKVVAVSVACVVVCGGVNLIAAEDVKKPVPFKESVKAKAQTVTEKAKNITATAQVKVQAVKEKAKNIDVAATEKKAKDAKDQAAAGMQKVSEQAEKAAGDLKDKGHEKTGSGLEKAGSKLESGAEGLKNLGK
ncbi:MAG: hypothetical protein NTU66_07325 [Elusimicrobia bacterium]|nr:hypothetical protein [Elusimicrobiota bacterium]